MSAFLAVLELLAVINTPVIVTCNPVISIQLAPLMYSYAVAWPWPCYRIPITTAVTTMGEGEINPAMSDRLGPSCWYPGRVSEVLKKQRMVPWWAAGAPRH